MNTLKDKVAIVTGASSGICRPTARLFAAEGAKVVASGRRKAELDALVEEIGQAGGEAVAIAGDVTDEAHAEALVAAAVGFPGMAAYAASKAGLVGLAQVLASEFGPKAVRVNVVLPGGTDTPANVVNAPGATAETRAFIEGLHALKRLARPDEIAQSVLHLASDAASFVTGAALLVDGGVSITRT